MILIGALYFVCPKYRAPIKINFSGLDRTTSSGSLHFWKIYIATIQNQLKNQKFYAGGLRTVDPKLPCFHWKKRSCGRILWSYESRHVNMDSFRIYVTTKFLYSLFCMPGWEWQKFVKVPLMVINTMTLMLLVNLTSKFLMPLWHFSRPKFGAHQTKTRWIVV